MLAAPGVPLLTIEDTRRFRMEVAWMKHDIALIRMGATGNRDGGCLGAEFAGKIVQIVPAADPASRSFLVKVELPAEPRLRSGLSGRVRFPRGNARRSSCRATAVLDRGQLQAVYVVGPDRLANPALRHPWQARRQRVEVLSGLTGRRMACGASPATANWRQSREIEARP